MMPSATTLTLALGACFHLGHAALLKSQTPPMGWNSYNRYGCSPREDIIRLNAQGLVDLGFADLGYNIVTVDCGWPARDRDEEGRLVWNETLFPSGPVALGEFIHGLGLKYGLYSGAGYLQCGSEDIPASLGFEVIDAQSFAEWGGDTLKYDNCYSTSTTQMVDSSSAESQSPERFIVMGDALNETDRDIQYFLCQWGIGRNVPEWAAPLGNSWRMSNDIFGAWRSIWRIVNQAVPHSRCTGPGAFADLDMLFVGLGALSPEEERFHFGFWAMMKSPLMIGGVMDREQIPEESLTIMSNAEVIAINQDPLAKAAELIIRYTEGEWDVWAGELSGGRKVIGVANWRNATQTVDVDLALIGVASAASHEPWSSTYGSVSGVETFELKPHELRILILSDIVAANAPQSEGYYGADEAALSGGAGLVNCPDNECLPTNQKVGNLGIGASATFEGVSSPVSGSVLLGVDFINYQYHFSEAWTDGTNTRNMTITVNDEEAKRWAFPLAGNDWYETGRLLIEVDGFVEGEANKVTFAAIRGRENYAPDLVGFEVLSKAS
ncbi:glycoside hydrolase superfamily [Stachybotrys elegans]|uniref:Alpha-galactosidase n=1 Tax=Stachybotrys elegans TaxID=80388 RepID=A0A8K0WMB2_9HYPO|nr:glycoside hydrolase superfamily [Stachybotrys elegans]